MTPANATIRGRIWRARRIDVTSLGARHRTHIDGGWVYEVRDGSRLLVRAAANTHQGAITFTCQHIRLAIEMAGS